MNADQFPPINVLCILKGFNSPKLQHKITPYRIEREDGRIYHIKEVRHCTKHRQGWTYKFQYVVRTKDDHFLELWFDGQTYMWKLTQVHTPDGIQVNC